MALLDSNEREPNHRTSDCASPCLASGVAKPQSLVRQGRSLAATDLSLEPSSTSSFSANHSEAESSAVVPVAAGARSREGRRTRRLRRKCISSMHPVVHGNRTTLRGDRLVRRPKFCVELSVGFGRHTSIRRTSTVDRLALKLPSNSLNRGEVLGEIELFV